MEKKKEGSESGDSCPCSARQHQAPVIKQPHALGRARPVAQPQVPPANQPQGSWVGRGSGDACGRGLGRGLKRAAGRGQPLSQSRGHPLGPGHGQHPGPMATQAPAPGQFKGVGEGDTPKQQQQQQHQVHQAQQQVAPKPSTQSTFDSPQAGQLVSINKGLRDMTVTEKRPPGAAPIGLKIPPRKNKLSAGTLGRKIRVDTNHLALNLSKLSKEVIHYDVTIDPDKPKRLMRPVMEEVKNQFYPNRWPAFDGKKNLFSSSPLPFGMALTAEIKVYDPERDREKEYKVTIKHVAKIDMKNLIENKMDQVSLIAVTALDIILRSAPAKRFVTVGRSFFTPPEGRVVDLGDGMEMWLGFFQSAIMGWKPFVNIDVAHKGFPKVQSCDKTIVDLFGRNRNFNPNAELMPTMVDEFMRYIKELKVRYMIPGQPNTKRTYRVNGVARCARKQDFELDDGRRITVEQYYADTKKYTLRFPLLPCLDVGSPNREKKILLPCELCTLVGGQVLVKKMSEIQTSNLIKQAATSTDDRRRKIMDALKKVDFNADPAVKEFGLNVSGTFESVDARVLEPPKLKYLDAAPVTPARGVWRNKQFVKGMALTQWTVLSVSPYSKDDAIKNFVQQIQQQARLMGMTMAPPAEPTTTKIQPHQANQLQAFMDKCAKDKIQLVFVIIQDAGNSYSKVKQMAELKVGLLTQCLKNRTLERMNPATCGNILLKVNAKLNGLNHHFDNECKPKCLVRPCMIVGADVTHPPPDQNNTPSVAAVCASFEARAFKYNIQYRLQPARAEIIEDLQAIMETQLRYFHELTKHKPEKIVFYRDGVSEGQFQEVLNKEFQAIRRACSAMEEGYQPKITFLVVQKRHHTRLFPTNPRNSEDRNNNVPAGTIVDTIITHPTDLDFYLVSHASIQGVARPTKYRRLWDDSDMSEDELQQLTYYLCHMFTRCTRSVSYPAPTYYAHLAAFRARAYIDSADQIDMHNLAMEQKNRTIKEVILKDNPMFFV